MPQKYHLSKNNCQDYAVHLFLTLSWSLELLVRFSPYLEIERTLSRDGDIWGYTYNVLGRLSGLHITKTHWVSIRTLYDDRLVPTCLVVSSIEVTTKVVGEREGHMIQRHDVCDSGRLIWSWESTLDAERFHLMEKEMREEEDRFYLEGRERDPRTISFPQGPDELWRSLTIRGGG